jgi:hypothetical protein
MDRHIELTALRADLDQQIAKAEALTKAPHDAETRRLNEQLLTELLARREDAMAKLREELISEHDRLKNSRPNPKLRGRERFNMHTRVRMELLFSPADRAEAERLLRILSTERERFAALRLSGGKLDKLNEAVALAKSDYRDLLLAAGFAAHEEKHQRWWPGQQMWPP